MLTNQGSSSSHTLPRAGDSSFKPTVRIADDIIHRSRPVSLYDNMRGGMTATGSGSLNSSSVGNLPSIVSPVPPMDRTPSQANCLSTTVPQNIIGANIGGRHAPTRNSLRHSRMIVLSRTGKVPRKYQPPVLRHHKLGTALAALQTLMGLAVSTLAVWLLLWAPNLRLRDIPYWSGAPLLLSGIFGLVLLCCCRKDYPGQPLGICMFSVKVISVTFAVLAAFACFCACVFALLHLVFLARMSCEPAHVLNATCICRSGGEETAANGTTQRMYHYADLNCPEVENILTVILIGSCAANGIAGVLATWYVFLHWNSRYTYMYSEVKTNENNPVVIPNRMETKPPRN
ncbi:sarcospan [Anabrus simplex]|uniref:sarcospan n=1 Tax=Anabrus simplex TaxID=316456 RepID=UPI0034DDB586